MGLILGAAWGVGQEKPGRGGTWPRGALL